MQFTINVTRRSILLSLVLFFGLFHHHHKPTTQTVRPVVTTDSTSMDSLIADDPRQVMADTYLLKAMVEMQQALNDCPWLVDKIQPAVTLISSLEDSKVTDPGYQDMFDQLQSDIQIVEKDEGNDTI